MFLDYARNFINQSKNGEVKPLFLLSDAHKSIGSRTLANLGVPEGSWYVTLHVREPNFRGETKRNTTENFRNSAISDYRKACQAEADMGGWVIRMGNENMSNIEGFPNTIDYANSSYRSEVMDVFLASTCRFCIGTASGFFACRNFLVCQ